MAATASKSNPRLRNKHWYLGYWNGQFRIEILPKNLSFRLGDLETLWMPEDQFDLIHTRVLPNDTRNWSEFYRTAHKHLREEGTLEIEALSLELSSDGKMPDLSPDLLLNHLNRETTNGDKKHLDFEKTKQLLDRAGFFHINETIIPLPTNPWDDEWDEKNSHRKDLGNRFNFGLQFLLGIGDFTPPGRDPRPQALEAIYSLSNHAYCRLSTVHGRKPLNCQKRPAEDDNGTEPASNKVARIGFVPLRTQIVVYIRVRKRPTGMYDAEHPYRD
ncbi:hypothetical protein LX36DRAFT_722984 [Colletotrichum falcatum]|nr:hypothetical protein LX36DRAFT_722984 [Colletotrichum falcatum]